ncbi:MAG TPA: twin-arginine translocation signal domain-containing protein [Ramlibacter sp.]|jgi:hypothetical protein|uniref:twin-arginine translocation signal domain-containing protein n=1 Tax=Ramlibacter sp. TaxID=1917967 RepID=UPI002D29C350|nr:twin-arginine translocation signal domain-containing protein [Ramlibacter sp.]HZY18274.1 twin-arginine translocation signal domain-containing protein [Ramlibacter sp.]
MTDKPVIPSRSRRDALGRLAAAAAAGAASTALPTQVQAQAPTTPVPAGDAAADGYHVTDHVRRYYKLARY